MILVSTWLTAIEKKYGSAIKDKALIRLKKWDNTATVQCFYDKKVLAMLLNQALEKQ